MLILVGLVKHMKTSPVIVLILSSVVLLVGCDQRREIQTPIDGLFGIRLDEPLPPSCTNSDSFVGKPDEWGFQLLLDINPQQTNSAFGSYEVTLTPSNRLVCSIWGKSSLNPDYESFNSVLKALHDHYGKEEFKSPSKWSANISTYFWSSGSHKLTLTRFLSPESFILSCDDTSLSYHPPHVADTNGL